MLTVHFRLVLRLRMRGAIPLLLLCAFMECAKATVSLVFLPYPSQILHSVS